MNIDYKEMAHALAKELSKVMYNYSEETGIPQDKVINNFLAGLREPILQNYLKMGSDSIKDLSTLLILFLD